MEIKNIIEITREEEILLLKGAKLWCDISDSLGVDFTDRGELLNCFSLDKYLDGQELYSGDGEKVYRFKVSEQ